VRASAPRIDAKLLTALSAIDDPTLPIAETNRRLGQVADLLRLPRPSYEQVRMHVHELRVTRSHSTLRDLKPLAQVLVDIAFRVRPPEALIAVLAGIDPPGEGW
jgi:hypothetical protein